MKSPREQHALASRLSIALDPSKRISELAQLARGLLALPVAKDSAKLAPPERALVRELLLAGGCLRLASVPEVAQGLVERGMVWAFPEGEGARLVLPLAYVVQMISWEGEDPRQLRALLVQTSDEVRANVAGYYLGRPAIRPIALALEVAWRHLTDPARVRAAFQELPANERAVLLAVEALGGEVDTEELLDLERDPLRMRAATGTPQTRRGVGYALERRGFLIPLHPNRHVIPAHIAGIIGEHRLEAREAKRLRVVQRIEHDYSPDRALPSRDPTALTLAMALQTRASGIELRANVAVPRSALQRLAASLGADVEAVALLAALSRPLGLWAESSLGSMSLDFPVGDLSRHLFERWRRGGVWDELRTEAEIMRGVSSSAEPATTHLLRELLLESIQVMGERTWIPVDALSEYVGTDTRVAGMLRLLKRWAMRTACEVLDLPAAVRRIGTGSLWALGIVDVSLDREPAASPGEGMNGPSREIRVTALGRALLAGDKPRADRRGTAGSEASHFLDPKTLRIGEDASVRQVLALAPWVEVSRVFDCLEVTFSQSRLLEYLARGGDVHTVIESFERVAHVPETLSGAIRQAGELRGHAQFVAASGFLWVNDEGLRGQLLQDPRTAGLFLAHSPSDGLLLAPGVSLARVLALCAGVGVRVDSDSDATGLQRVAGHTRGRRKRTGAA
jgi:hypothetical protein